MAPLHIQLLISQPRLNIKIYKRLKELTNILPLKGPKTMATSEIGGNRRSGGGADCYIYNGRLFSITATRLLTDRPTTVQDYEYYLKDLPKASTSVLEYHYEIGKECNRLHIHGIISYNGKRKPQGKKFYKKGWNVKIDPIIDLAGWQRYIRKDIDVTNNRIEDDLFESAPYPHNINLPYPTL